MPKSYLDLSIISKLSIHSVSFMKIHRINYSQVQEQEKMCLQTSLFLVFCMNHVIDYTQNENQNDSRNWREPHSICLFTNHTLRLIQFFSIACFFIYFIFNLVYHVPL